MKYVLNHEGRPYAKYFEDISAIPRGSYKEDAIADYIVEFAQSLELPYHRDKANNVLIRKPASSGYENADTVLLQGHMDMIWAKRPGSTFDFETQPLELMVKDGFLMAKETTCGSDDGVAVAYMMAVLADHSLKHPALECVFTATEEPGIVGALQFDFSQIRARKYISMDGNLEGTSLLIASGGINGEFRKTFLRVEAVGKQELEITVSGLTGGHTSNAQNKELANALKIVARILCYASKEMNLGLVSIDGGAETTIPTQATAKVAATEKDVERIKKLAKTIVAEVKEEHRDSDPGISLKLETHESAGSVIEQEAADSIITLLYLLPVGLINRSLVFENLPVTSCSLEFVSTKDQEIICRYRPQSAMKSKLLDLEEQANALGKMCGVEYRTFSRYFGHNIKAGTPFYQLYDQVWHEMTGEHIRPIGAHYGNEIGTFLEKLPDLDVILLVATHYDAHTPEERLDLASFDRCYQCLVKILERAK